MHRMMVLIVAVAAASPQPAASAGSLDRSGRVGLSDLQLAQTPSEEELAKYWSDVDPSVIMLDSVRQVIDSIRSKTVMPQKPLEHLQKPSNVRIILFSDLQGKDRAYDVTARGEKTVDEVLWENRETILKIRDQLRVNFAAVRALDAAGFTADQVLTWETAGTELLAIVVDDRGRAGQSAEQ